VYCPSWTSPTRELSGSTLRSSAVTVTTVDGSSRGITVATSNSFCTLAGAEYSCGPQAASTAPGSRSATTQNFAEMSDGSGCAPAGRDGRVVAGAVPPIAGVWAGGPACGNAGSETVTVGHATYATLGAGGVGVNAISGNTAASTAAADTARG